MSSNATTVQTNSSFVNKWGSSCLLNTHYRCHDPDGASGPLTLGDGQFSSIWGIAADSGKLYVLDVSNNRIQVFSDNGTFIRKWGSFCQIGSDYTSSQLCSDPDGSQGSLKLGDGQFSHPTSIALDTGQIFVADNLNDRIQVFSSNLLSLRSPQPLTQTIVNINNSNNSNTTTRTNVFGNANNTAPVANNQTITTNVNTPKTITLSAIDANSDNLTGSVTRPPTNGQLSEINQNTGEVTYTPANDYTGTDSFQFKVTDDKGADSNIATISINVS